MENEEKIVSKKQTKFQKFFLALEEKKNKSLLEKMLFRLIQITVWL